jgi:two-component system chemotaxis response regulator CheY
MSKKVLVVDDSGVLRNIIVFNLKKAGYEIQQAVDGIDGLEKISEFKPDMIVLDIMMPRLDGFGVLNEKSKNDEIKDIPVLILTAKGGEDDKEKAIALGACDVLTKPFSPKQLVNSVKQVIGDAT